MIPLSPHDFARGVFLLVAKPFAAVAHSDREAAAKTGVAPRADA
jgi:hypothetical protein